MKEHFDRFNFEFYRLGVHHIALCTKSGVVLDSSSKAGAFTLDEGLDVIYENEQGEENIWEFSGPSTSRFIKLDNEGNTKAC